MDTEDEVSVDPADSPYSSDSPSEHEHDGITRGELLKSRPRWRHQRFCWVLTPS